MTSVEVPYSWPVALHPDARPVPRSEQVVDVVLGDEVVRIVTSRPGLPALINRLRRERPLGEFLAENACDGFQAAQTQDVLAHLGRAGMLRRLADPRLSADELRDFEREIGALARFETAQTTRFELFSRLRQAHVLLVGCGLTGAHVAQHLTASGVGEISLVDPADILPGHAGRHPWFFLEDVGRPKAAVLRDRILATTPHTRARALRQTIGSEAHLDRVLDSAPAIDVLVYAFDAGNLSFGTWAARCARRRSFALLRVNRHVVGPLTRPGRDEACPACVVPRLERGVQELQQVLMLAGAARDDTAFLWSSELAAFGALAAHELLVCMTGVGEPVTRDCQVAPGPGGVLREVKPFPRDAECPVCSPGASHGSPA